MRFRIGLALKLSSNRSPPLRSLTKAPGLQTIAFTAPGSRLSVRSFQRKGDRRHFANTLGRRRMRNAGCRRLAPRIYKSVNNISSKEFPKISSCKYKTLSGCDLKIYDL